VPTYQYACTECGHAFEQVQSFSDDALTTCPECTGRLRKVFNAVGVVFKGSGFYRTDSRAKDSSSSSSGSSDSTTKTETKSDSKSETKSGTKSETKSSDSSAKTPAASTASTT
jgi:putative FmdB family regulatory protein